MAPRGHGHPRRRQLARALVVLALAVVVPGAATARPGQTSPRPTSRGDRAARPHEAPAAVSERDPREVRDLVDPLDRDLDELGDAVPPDPLPVAHLPAPSIDEVLAAAYAAAGLDRAPGRGLARRARLTGLVPWISVRTGQNARWRDDVPDVGRGTAVEVRATWRLDRLVFEPRELQIATLEAARRRERRQLAEHVIQTYFGWKRARLAGSHHVRSASRVEQAQAELDALTHGWFSEAVEARRRTASEPRTPGVLPATP